MNKYPEYVKKFKPRGTIVKKVRDKYYVYKATSKRVEGKNYPVQVIQGLLGCIDEYGFHELNRMVIDKEDVIIRECGFTNFLLLFEDICLNDLNVDKSKKDSKIIFYSLIVYLSSNSYLIDQNDVEILSLDELTNRYKISISRQLNSLKKMIGVENLQELEQLKYICNVKVGNKILKSKLNKYQKELINILGVDENELR